MAITQVAGWFGIWDLGQVYSYLIFMAAPHSNLSNTYTSALVTLPKYQRCQKTQDANTSRHLLTFLLAQQWRSNSIPDSQRLLSLKKKPKHSLKSYTMIQMWSSTRTIKNLQVGLFSGVITSVYVEVYTDLQTDH